MGVPLTSRNFIKSFFLSEAEPLSPLASAYARARGADRMSSFGDFISRYPTVCDEAYGEADRPRGVRRHHRARLRAGGARNPDPKSVRGAYNVDRDRPRLPFLFPPAMCARCSASPSSRAGTT